MKMLNVYSNCTLRVDLHQIYEVIKTTCFNKSNKTSNYLNDIAVYYAMLQSQSSLSYYYLGKHLYLVIKTRCSIMLSLCDKMNQRDLKGWSNSTLPQRREPYFFFWPLCCLFFFDIRLIAPLVSSNSTYLLNPSFKNYSKFK